MKKNKFLKLASGLLVLCLLTTCVISTTFAKYTTSGSANDTARVAKWGVTITAQNGGTEGFATSYENDEAIPEVTVESTDKVVAPGTGATLAQFTISGTPEVSVNLTVNVTKKQDVFLKAGNYKDWTTQEDDTFNLADDYYPVVYILTKDGVEVKKGNLNDIATYLDAMDTDCAVGTTEWADLCGTYKITWAWDFDGSGAGTNDKADTLLGNLTTDVATDAYSTLIDFAFEITATQID